MLKAPVILTGFELPRDPVEQVLENFAPVDLIQHLVSSTGVKIVRDVTEARFAIALYQNVDALSCSPTGSSLPENRYNGKSARISPSSAGSDSRGAAA